MDDLRERFSALRRRVDDLDVPNLLPDSEARARRVRRPAPAVRRRARVPFPALVAAVVGVSAAVGWAFVVSSARDTVSVQCEIGRASSVIPAATGDPVADCAAQWERETGRPAPRLIAYDNQLGGITVLPAGETPPRDWVALPQGQVQDAAIVELQQWADDYVAGLNSGCFDNATATQMTGEALTRLGMTGWDVHPAPADEVTANCVDTVILDAATRTVQLRALGGAPDADAVYVRLAGEIRRIADACPSLETATRQVRSAAGALGLAEDRNEYQLTRVRDDSMGCTTIYENVGGTIFLILRGPPSGAAGTS
jgi:hypothetical protein